jgi:hypothetical protein
MLTPSETCLRNSVYGYIGTLWDLAWKVRLAVDHKFDDTHEQNLGYTSVAKGCYSTNTRFFTLTGYDGSGARYSIRQVSLPSEEQVLAINQCVLISLKLTTRYTRK